MMKRGHTALEYKSIIRKITCGTSKYSNQLRFHCWLPGETNEEFEQTMNLIAQVNFDMSFSFIYSARPGTPAADMPDDVTEEEKKQRLYLLQERINQQAAQYSRPYAWYRATRVGWKGRLRKILWN